MSKIKLGAWSFHELRLQDIELFSYYMSKSDCPSSRFSSNFPFLWANSYKSRTKVLWKTIDDMLVTFAYIPQKRQLHLVCLPFGSGDAEKVVTVLLTAMKFCFAWNNNNHLATTIDTINGSQYEFLKNSARFDTYFRVKKLEGKEIFWGIHHLITLSGKEFRNIRGKINRFRLANPEAVIRKYSLYDYQQMLNLKKHWNNAARQKYYHIGDDAAYQAVLKYAQELDHLILVAEADNKIVGMVSGGPLPNGLSWCYFHKSVYEYKGLAEVLYVELAKEINRINPQIELLNVGNDSGGGLQSFKEKFRPVLSLDRFTVYPRK